MKWAANHRVRRFRLKLFSVLSETVFVHIFHVSYENENERRTLRSWEAQLSANIYGPLNQKCHQGDISSFFQLPTFPAPGLKT
jgi:hypothetical protein